ncbi:FkbM family methyltransferase [Bacteroidia bacterium]|nr:FkbM family methyltransferase [Bacteroidia bacterium]MDB9881619.1 FkbM family methyltransferase [Bacteroidia bacterium]MDC1395073.1 FkbM family methyltransferase [Bacteroidia bacterium]
MRRIIKKVLKIIREPQQFSFILSLNRPNNELQIQNLLQSLVKKNLHDNFFFIQIGANYGVSFDLINSPINEFNLKGLCLEPVNEYFNQLVETYKNSNNVTCLNLAIHPTEKSVELYKVDANRFEDLPNWSKGIASIHPEHHKLSGTPSIAIQKEVVDAISFQELIQKYKLKYLDLLAIDTEGFDLDIIHSINFDQITPSIIIFEHLVEYEETKQALFDQIITKLSHYGYLIFFGRPNIIAYKVS